MADEVTFDDLIPENFEGTESPFREEPLSLEERMIVQNLFDTQPEKRKAFMEQIGLELDPEDDNKYRPLGSDLEFNAEIDPGIGAWFGKGGLAEIGKDLGDIAVDMATGPAVTGASILGGVGGAAAGSAVPVLGTGIGAVIGTILGGGLGNATVEAFKDIAGDLVLDESIPTDFKATAIQSLLVGATPQVLKGLKSAGAGTIRKLLESRKNAIVTAAKKSGNGLTPELLDKAAKNPEMFTEEAVEGANRRLYEQYKGIFGIAPDDPVNIRSTRQINPESAFGKKLQPLNEAATKEINELAQMPEANWKLGELLGGLKSAIMQIEQKKLSQRTPADREALKWLKNKSKEITEDFGKGVDPKKLDQVEINFKEGRDILKAAQREIFEEKGDDPLYSTMRQVFGGGPNGLRALADRKAGAVGSKLPDINAQRNAIFDTFKKGRPELTPTKIQNAFIGNDTLAKESTRDAFTKLDATLGTNFTELVETGGMQRVVEQMYRNPQAFGSGRVIPDALSQATKDAMAGAGAGFGLGYIAGNPTGGALLGGGLGALRGASKGALLSSPEGALKALGQTNRKLELLEQTLPLSVTKQATGTAAVAAGVDGLGASEPDEEEITFDDLMPQE